MDIEQDLTEALVEAVRSAIQDLFRENPGQNFYYISLISSAVEYPPFLIAWSKEAWDKTGNDPDVKWDYADAPFFDVGKKYFGPVGKIYDKLPDLSDVDLDEDLAHAEEKMRFRAMETALRLLDTEALFGEGETRQRILINVEFMPPVPENTDRARRLNPPDALALVEWLAEAAEVEE